MFAWLLPNTCGVPFIKLYVIMFNNKKKNKTCAHISSNLRIIAWIACVSTPMIQTGCEVVLLSLIQSWTLTHYILGGRTNAHSQLGSGVEATFSAASTCGRHELDSLP